VGERATDKPLDTTSSHAQAVIFERPTASNIDSEIAFAARVVDAKAENATEQDTFTLTNSARPQSVAHASYDEPPFRTPPAVVTAPSPHAAVRPAIYRDEPAVMDSNTASIDAAAPAQGSATPAPAVNPTPHSSTPMPVEPPAGHHRMPAAEIPPPPPEPARPAQPVRDMTVRLTTDAQSVVIKLVDRHGELHVAVHSVDQNLTSDLRARVHDLVGGLEKNGFRAETWQPGDSFQSQTGEDPRRQGRNAYEPQPMPARRDPGSNDEWMNYLSALTGAERNN
jgi:hypothetical protein